MDITKVEIKRANKSHTNHLNQTTILARSGVVIGRNKSIIHKKKAHKLEEICGETRSHAMPLPSYLWFHRDAVLTESDINTLCTWTEAERKLIVVPE